MFLQTQPSQWSCVPTAFAMLLDIAVEEMIRQIGHDGSEVVWPELEPTALSKRAFHPQECIDVALSLDIPIVSIHLMPYTLHFVNNVPSKPIWTEQQCLDRFDRLLKAYEGVFTGTTNYNMGHAVAWNGKMVYDPRGYIKPLEEANFNPQIFFIKFKSKSNIPAI